jgi:hypothetical protein
MNCPGCKKETEISLGSPQVTRLRVEGCVVHATVEVTDLCSECFDTLRHAKLDIERDISGAVALKEHLGHKILLEATATERIEDTPGYIAVLMHFEAACACDKAAHSYHGTIPGSSKWD